MTAHPQDVALLPLPALEPELENLHPGLKGFIYMYARDYARANVTAALASAQAREEELRAEVALLTHKLITCGVAADHPNPNLTRTGAYASEWDSQQAERVRGLRDRAERLEEALRELAQQMRRDALGCDRDGYRDPAIVKRDCAARIDAALSTNAATQTGETNEAAE
jgi:hypothetical protein